MKKTLLVFSIIISFLLFQGCSEEHNEEIIKGKVITMEIGVNYTVSSGDRLISHSTGTQINVVHTLSNGTKIVNLISGDATLIKVNS